MPVLLLSLGVRGLRELRTELFGLKLHIAAELSLSSATDAEVATNLLKQMRLTILEISAYGAFDRSNCHDAI